MKIHLLALLLLATTAYAQATKPRSKVNAATAGKVLGQQQQTLPQRQLIEFYERELLASDKKGNWSAIAGRLADDFLEIAGDGRYYTKEQIANLFPEQRVADYKISDMQFRSLGPNAAMLAYRLEVQATFQGKPLPGRFGVSSVWRKQDGIWKVVFHQGTPIPAEAAGKH